MHTIRDKQDDWSLTIHYSSDFSGNATVVFELDDMGAVGRFEGELPALALATGLLKAHHWILGMPGYAVHRAIAIMATRRLRDLIDVAVENHADEDPAIEVTACEAIEHAIPRRHGTPH